jgi:hypothetical protein
MILNSVSGNVGEDHSGGAQSARRLLTEAFVSRLRSLQAA